MRQPNGYRIMTLNINCLVNTNSRIGLVDVLRRNQPHVLCLQEVNIPQVELQDLVDPLKYNCFTNSVENGRGTAILWMKCLNVRDSTAVVVNRIAAIELEDYFIVNVYAHSGRAKRMERAELFAHDLNPFLASRDNKKIILCGDFNSVLENIDAVNNPQQKKSKELKSLVCSNKLVDSYRFFYPQLPGYTFIRNNAASRLDYIFVPESDKSKILEVNVVPVPSSDHVAVCVDLLLDKNSVANKITHSLNYWKLNNETL